MNFLNVLPDIFALQALKLPCPALLEHLILFLGLKTRQIVHFAMQAFIVLPLLLLHSYAPWVIFAGKELRILGTLFLPRHAPLALIQGKCWDHLPQRNARIVLLDIIVQMLRWPILHDAMLVSSIQI